MNALLSFCLLLMIGWVPDAAASEVPGVPAEVRYATTPAELTWARDLERSQRLARHGLYVALVANAVELPLAWVTLNRGSHWATWTGWGAAFAAGEVGLGMNAVGNHRVHRLLQGASVDHRAVAGTVSLAAWSASWGVPLGAYLANPFPAELALGLLLRVPLYWTALVCGAVQTHRNGRAIRATTAPIARRDRARVDLVAVPGGVGIRGVF